MLPCIDATSLKSHGSRHGGGREGDIYGAIEECVDVVKIASPGVYSEGRGSGCPPMHAWDYPTARAGEGFVAPPAHEAQVDFQVALPPVEFGDSFHAWPPLSMVRYLCYQIILPNFGICI